MVARGGQGRRARQRRRRPPDANPRAALETVDCRAPLLEEALSDPELRRTKLELEAALHNAKQAREVVFELYQDLERFSLEDYRPLSNVAEPTNASSTS